MFLETIPRNAMIVVATGAGAKFFRNVGRKGVVELEAAGKLSPQDLDDDGPSGKSPPDQSLQETDEATFSKQLANRLYRDAHAGRADSFVIVADPGTLGELRPLLHKEVSDRVVRQISKTLTHHTTEELTRLILKN